MHLKINRNKNQAFFLKLCVFVALLVAFTACKGDNSQEVVSIIITPTDSTVTAAVAGFVQFVATATYGDGSTGDVTNDVEWQSFSLVAPTPTDLLFDSPASSLAILRSTGTFVIQATFDQFSNADTTVLGLTTIIIN